MAIPNLISTVYSATRALLTLWLSLLLAVLRLPLFRESRLIKNLPQKHNIVNVKFSVPTISSLNFSLMVKSLSAYCTPIVRFFMFSGPKWGCVPCITNDNQYTQPRIIFSKLRYFIVNNYADIFGLIFRTIFMF